MGQWIEPLDGGFMVRDGLQDRWYCPHVHSVIRKLAGIFEISEPEDEPSPTVAPRETDILGIGIMPLENGYKLQALFSSRPQVNSYVPTEEGVLRKIIALLHPATANGTSAERSHKDAEPRTTAEKAITEAVHGRPPANWRGPLDSSCSLFDAIWAYLGPEQNGYAYAVHRYLLRFRRTFVSPDPRLSDVTPNVLAAYLGGPGGTESQSQVHAKILNDFLAWCMERGLVDSTEWSGAQFHEHHPVLGKNRWYKRSSGRSPQ